MGVGAHYRRGPVPFALHAKACSWKYTLKLVLPGGEGMEILFLGTRHSPELEAESGCSNPTKRPTQFLGPGTRLVGTRIALGGVSRRPLVFRGHLSV